jgi:histidine ammonia-lyase
VVHTRAGRGGVGGLVRPRAPARRAPRAPARATAAAVAALRGVGPGPGPDRLLAPELAEVERLVGSGMLLAAVEAQIGELG